MPPPLPDYVGREGAFWIALSAGELRDVKFFGGNALLLPGRIEGSAHWNFGVARRRGRQNHSRERGDDSLQVHECARQLSLSSFRANSVGGTGRKGVPKAPIPLNCLVYREARGAIKRCIVPRHSGWVKMFKNEL